MNLNVLYFSPTGTTRQVVEHLSKTIECDQVNTYDLTDSSQRESTIEFTSEDLLIVGVPVYAGRVPQVLMPSFEKIRGNGTKAVFVVVYGNRAYEDALLELKNNFESRGFIGIAAGAFIGEHSYTHKVATNRPDQEDLKVASDFGVQINKKLQQELPITLSVKGSFPYKALMTPPKLAPTTDESCIDCGLCVKVCPMDAINPKNVKDIDVDQCIRCCACIHKCPVDSKHLENEPINQIRNMLETNLSNVRREIELF